MRYKAIYFLSLFLIVWTVGKQSVGQSLIPVPGPTESPTPGATQSPTPSISPIVEPSPGPIAAPTPSASPYPSLAPTPETRGVRTTKISIPENGRVVDREMYKGGSYALVIGMSSYSNWRKLPGVNFDIKEVKSVLEEHGFEVETAMDLYASELGAKIEQFVKGKGKIESSRILLYFAGHGYTLRKKDGSGESIGYIVPVDAPDPRKDEDKFRQVAVSTEAIQRYAAEIEGTHSLFVFDSCFSGYTTRSGISRPLYINTKLAKPARQFISSGSETEEVPDDSIFRKRFVDGLRGLADTIRPDGYVTATELGEYLTNKVTQESKGQQTPQSVKLGGLNYKDGDMIFSIGYNMAALSESQAWKIAEQQRTVAGYTLFIKSFPESSQRDKALEMMLTILKENNASLGISEEPTVIVRGAEPRIAPLPFTTARVDEKGVVVDRKPVFTESLGEDLGNGESLVLVKIPAGKFKMGSNSKDAKDNEKPEHDVTVGDYYMGAFEVTRKQWDIVAGWKKVQADLRRTSPLGPEEANLPITDISWEEAVEFCARLEQKTGRVFALPTEAEWEYAARAGAMTKFAFGDLINREIANYDVSGVLSPNAKGTSLKRPVAVGSLGVANKFGLYDMHGNVAEWCYDDWINNYENAPGDSRPRVNGSKSKVVRGGSFNSQEGRITSSSRAPQSWEDVGTGFRVVMRSVVRPQ